ncbi:hypothetical protein [Oceaniglobus roseus]|uniref:hypothetical protein n=1 Tax=Oceaniglobus roseus TaxID=1737570 RepID=UPI000C7F4A93|nr:hypothetical protein [Kandeliimicrobium roseum]
MAERQRSTSGTRETERFTSDTPTPGQQGRAQGNLERDVGTRSEAEAARQGESNERVRKSDEKGEGNLGGHHGTGEGQR